MQSSEEAISSRLKKRKIFLLLFVIRHYIAIFVTILFPVRKFACFSGWRLHKSVKNCFSELKFAKSQENLVI